ncbi:hypothetical protein AVEN_16759-1 [Araneus ventricosus]|uniref:Uncharacterized protein n=1 Tax=Araneus ventricosus TaxID=182803 RepID=A0A4Y2I2I4_ARAVE|nr:hypothetical protein AVEN_16759-1 [Araneus ventricosus]
MTNGLNQSSNLGFKFRGRKFSGTRDPIPSRSSSDAANEEPSSSNTFRASGAWFFIVLREVANLSAVLFFLTWQIYLEISLSNFKTDINVDKRKKKHF